MSDRIKISHASFSITSNCNLNCHGCTTHSNYHFNLMESWKEQRPTFEKWSRLIDIEKFEIYGGEPFLNPEWMDWFTGLKKLWPDARICFTSNGYPLAKKYNQQLYQLLSSDPANVWLEVSHHNNEKIDFLFERIKSMLQGNVSVDIFPGINETFVPFMTHSNTVEDYIDQRLHLIEDRIIPGYQDVKDVSWPEVKTLDDWNQLPGYIKQECDELHGISIDKLMSELSNWKLTDDNGVTVIVRRSEKFLTGPTRLVRNDQGFAVEFHESDPVKAHTACMNKDKLHFAGERLHKCSTVGGFQEAARQFKIDLTDRQQDLLDTYTTAHADMSLEELQDWIDNEWLNPIPQCSFCPEQRKEYEINATTKKIDLYRVVDK